MDIQNQERIENGKVINDLILWVKGKTGKRDVVAKSSDVSEYLKRLFEYRSNELQKQTNGKIIKPNKNEPVFCNENGNVILSFKKSYKHFLESVGLLKNANGDTRTIYSLRHTYATFRLMNGVDSYVLSKNLGTSVKMIELHYGHTTNRGFASELTKNKSNNKENKLPWE
jgi:site-specific recombinase XerD